ncbi:hypothetical protein [Coleofasciculus sp. E1-EBD-02]|uniref:hypothetical protein n=1 Tax=Coleofasciculus sp. E1-EBD-02 TaxID=3068481 RepID=UPI0033004B00
MISSTLLRGRDISLKKYELCWYIPRQNGNTKYDHLSLSQLYQQQPFQKSIL